MRGHTITSLGKNINIFKIVCTKYMASSDAINIINSLICIFISMFPEMFRENLPKFKLPYVSTDFHQVFTVLFDFFLTFF